MPSQHEHVRAFISSFVMESRKKRWLYLFDRKRKKFGLGANELLRDLDPEYLVKDRHLDGLADHGVTGVLHELREDRITTARLDEVIMRPPHFDAIFLIEPGRLAVFLFHEGDRYLLRRP